MTTKETSSTAVDAREVTLAAVEDSLIRILPPRLAAETIQQLRVELDGNCGSCWKCYDASGTRPYGYVLCILCGNKRCSHAADHDLKCTRSNEPGQPGATRYPRPRWW